MTTRNILELRFYDAAGVERAWKVLAHTHSAEALEARTNTALVVGGKVCGRVARWVLTARALGFARVTVHSHGSGIPADVRRIVGEVNQGLERAAATHGLQLFGGAPPADFGSHRRRVTFACMLRYVRSFQEQGEPDALLRAAGEFGLDPLRVQRAYLEFATVEPVLGAELRVWD